MGRRPTQVCAVCGMGGMWVGYSGAHGEDRCVNHLEDEVSEDSYIGPDVRDRVHRAGE